MKWTVFDLEFTQLLPAVGQPWGPELHVACASMLSSGESWPQVWYEAPPAGTLAPGDYMSETTLAAFVEALEARVAAGFCIATWGGSASDWRMLAQQCPRKASAIRDLALGSVDVPMCSCMAIGTMMGLNAACKALGFSIKEEDSSQTVPATWGLGTPEARAKVLQHVSNDSFATMMVLKHAENTRVLPWITQRGQVKTWNNVQLLTVRTCLARELPATPWVIPPHQNAKLLARWLILEQ